MVLNVGTGTVLTTKCSRICTGLHVFHALKRESAMRRFGVMPTRSRHFVLMSLCTLGSISGCCSFVSPPLRPMIPQSSFDLALDSLRQAAACTPIRRKASVLPLKIEANEAKSTSKYSKRFDDMLERLAQYPNTQVLSVKDPRTRTVLAGIIEGIEVPEVRDAFRVLYEDYPPVRFGGDFLFKQLESTIKSTETNTDLSESALSSSSLLKAKQVFKLADVDGSGELDRREVQEFLVAVQDGGMKMTWEQAEDFVGDLDKDNSGTVSFPEFVKAAEELFKKDDDAKVVNIISLSLGGTRTQVRESEGSGNKYARRFDGMIASFREMEQSIDTAAIPNRRLATVFKGCIVGGRTQGVTDALKVLYVDYRIIRMCGDLIFGLVKALMQQ